MSDLVPNQAGLEPPSTPGFEQSKIEAINAVREVFLTEIYQEGALAKLGHYNPVELRLLRPGIDAIHEGNAKVMSRVPLSIKFGVMFTTEADVLANISADRSGIYSLGVHIGAQTLAQNPNIELPEGLLRMMAFPIKKGEVVSLDAFISATYPGGRKNNSLTRALSKSRVLRETGTLGIHYDYFYLDPKTKRDICVLANDGTYEVYRKLNTTDNFEVWGQRINVNKSEITNAQTDTSNKIYSFSLQPTN